VAARQLGQVRGDQEVGQRFRRGQLDAAGDALSAAPLHGLHGALHLGHVGEELAALVGELVAALLAQEEAHAEARFHGVDVAGHGGGAGAQRRGRRREAAGAGHGEEVAQVVPVQGGRHCLSNYGKCFCRLSGFLAGTEARQ
jgi:hypothetical protein